MTASSHNLFLHFSPRRIRYTRLYRGSIIKPRWPTASPTASAKKITACFADSEIKFREETRRNKRKSRKTREPVAMFQIPRTALAWCAPRICPTVNDPGKTDDDDHFALPFFSRFRPSILETPASTSAGMHAEYRLSSSHPQSRLRAPCLPFSPVITRTSLEASSRAKPTTPPPPPPPRFLLIRSN